MKNTASGFAAGMAALVLFLLSPALAGAQSWTVEGPAHPCDVGTCERGYITGNFEGDGVTVSLTSGAAALVLGKDGLYHGPGTIEVRGPALEGWPLLVLRHDAEFTIGLVATGGPEGCAAYSVASWRVVAPALASGEFAELRATGTVRAADPFCFDTITRGELTIARGQGNLRKSWGETKASNR